MRSEPLTYAEQKMFERELLRDLGYADEEQHITYNANGTSTVETHWKIREGHDRNVVKALHLARTFNTIMSNEPEQPACFDDLVLEVRYKMGYGWLAWFLFKNFAIPVLRWLWDRYHNSIPDGATRRANAPVDPTDFGAHVDRMLTADPELAKLVLEAEQEIKQEAKCTCPVLEGIKIPGSSCSLHGLPDIDW